jgi:flagellar biosynthesis protein FlhF
MTIKSYFSRTIEEAMAQASQELGPEAMLVNTRKAPPEARHLGEYEVVFATDAQGSSLSQAGTQASAALPAALPAAAPPAAANDRLSLEVADLKRELEGMRRALTRTAFSPSQWMGASPNACDAYAALTASELAPELAREIVQCAGARAGEPQAMRSPGLPTSDTAAFRKALVEELVARFTVQSSLGRGDMRPRIVALVGPPGCGKTTTLVKLAVSYGLAARRPVMVLSMDTYRVAAAEQLRSYATIVGVGFQVLETVTALAQALEEHRSKELVLIDTPGFSGNDLEAAAPLAHFFSTRSDVDTQLVLPCSMKGTDMARVAATFTPFRAQRLLFTKLDETASFGPVFGEAVRSGRPISYFTTGQRIPEDLEAATQKRLVELVLSGARAAERAAA